MIKQWFLLLACALCVASSQSAQQQQYVMSLTERVVEFSFLPRELLSVDGSSETVKVTGILTAEWSDKVANGTAFTEAGTNSDDAMAAAAPIDVSKIWKPRVVMLNSAKKDSNVLVPENGIAAYRSGDYIMAATTWSRRFHFTCSFKMHWFPSDEHTCYMILLATEFALPDIRVASVVSQFPSKIASSLFSGNSEWKLLGFDLRNVTLTGSDPSGYIMSDDPGLAFRCFAAEFRVRRRSTYYLAMMLAPLILLTLLQMLTYFVPIESGEKLSCGMTVLLGFTMFLQLIDNIVPKSTDLPAITFFIVMSMVVSGLSLFMNSLILRMYHAKDGSLVPAWLDVILKKLMCSAETENKWEISGEMDYDEMQKSNCMTWRKAAEVLERVTMISHGVITVVAMTLFFTTNFRI